MSKKKNKRGQGVAILISLICGAMLGIAVVRAAEGSSSDSSFSYLSLFVAVISIYAALILHTVIHEAGHLVFGLVTGYKFCSFRIFRFMWLKDGDKLKFKKLSLAGTAGQCLMAPPDISDGRIPTLLYNLGGSIMNLAATLVFLVPYILLSDIPYLSTVLIAFVCGGVIMALTNGIPMRMALVDNDGYNAYSASRSPEAARAFWIQLKIGELTANGVRLANMPDEWFEMPSESSMKNSLIASVAVFSCNRLMETSGYEEADAQMERLLSSDADIIGLHRRLLVCDRIYCELILRGSRENADALLDKDQKSFMKNMKTYPSVLRTEYTYALLALRDSQKAAKYKQEFEKCAATYPYQTDIDAERKLLALADSKLL